MKKQRSRIITKISLDGSTKQFRVTLGFFARWRAICLAGKTILVFLTAWTLLASPLFGKITEDHLFEFVEITWQRPNSHKQKWTYALPIDMEGIGKWNDYIAKRKSEGYEVAVNGVADPSLAYNVWITQPEEDDLIPGFLSVEMPITSLAGPNTVSAELTIELTDSNQDGIATLSPSHGFGGFQRAFIFENNGEPIFNPSWDLGSSEINAPGIYTYRMEPQPGVIDPDADTLRLIVRFDLSPGDTAQFKGNVIIDDGSGAPVAQIPLLPSEGASCETFSTITAPSAVIVDFATIASCTTLDVVDGGQVGNLVSAGHHGGGAIDTEVNILGGKVGNSFLANEGSVVNVSGGSIGSGFSAHHGSVVNIFGGTIGNSLSANQGSVVNISDGLLEGVIRVNEGGLMNVSGGTFQNLLVYAGGEANVSGGTGVVIGLEGGIVNLTGGDIGELQIFANHGSQLNVHGDDFRLDGAPISNVNPGEAFSLNQPGARLSGRFPDGTPFDFELCTENCEAGRFQTGATINLILDESRLLGDLNNDGVLNAPDIDLLVSDNANFDLTGDGVVNQDDRTFWVEDLANTYFGDTNLDGEFNSGDLIDIFKVGEYEDEITQNSTWSEGDWNGDRDFGSGDLVLAFKSLGYERGPRLVATVPEPSYMLGALTLLLAITVIRQSERVC